LDIKEYLELDPSDDEDEEVYDDNALSLEEVENLRMTRHIEIIDNFFPVVPLYDRENSNIVSETQVINSSSSNGCIIH
jgi:hypothetical protein